MNENQWRTVFIITATVCSFFLAQDEVQFDPIVKLMLGAINVALAAIAPGKLVKDAG